ncbi:alginate export family protein [Pseudocolwellia sp. AS88]|uniref:alginate export family protein n=1 Tax=Pseudocolwellia sp. AS88 TaxID=3063958 RepID=UPI0026EFC96F|nr:alginate export family protein [Pseudocolwellia sp. AS88]MDO7086286.1 alginate export family protein [Pseudocolwellia sp. AS88]
MKLNKISLLVTAALASTTLSTLAADESKTTLDFNLRYESVDQDNALKDASALTLRTRLTHATASYNGFSAVVEFEDSRVIAGVDNYNDTTGNNAGIYSVVADPETTELDQAYVQYKTDKFTAKVGRQVVTLDGHRFVGHVGWRQDRQTFDAANFMYQASEKLSGSYTYISKRNRIFAEANDLDSKDHLLNVAYKTSLGKVVGYAYLLEVDNGTDNGLDTYGISFTGKKDGFLYAAEIATQSDDASDADTSYLMLEGGYNFGKVTAKLGYESLGSDKGVGFSTPLATAHKFNGWADQFLGTPGVGLEDIYATVSTKVLGGNLSVTYHDFSSDVDSVDLGSEIDAVYAKGFAKNYKAGVKLASYSAGDAGSGKVDTDKIWVFVTAKF